MPSKNVFEIVIWYNPTGSETIRTRPLDEDEFRVLVRQIEECGTYPLSLNVWDRIHYFTRDEGNSKRWDFIPSPSIKKVSLRLVEDAETRPKGRPRND